MRLRHNLKSCDFKKFRFACLALMLLAPDLAAAGDDGDGLFFYQRNGERVPVTPVPWSFGVHSDRATTDELTDLLNKAGHPGAAVRDYSSFDWWFVELRAASDPPPIQGAAGLIAKFLDLDRRWRFFFTPEFRTATSRYYYFAPGIVAKFEEGVRGRRIDELLAAVGASVADIEPLGTGTHTYRFETRHRSALDVLDSANSLFLLPEVVYAFPAGPDFGGGVTSPPDDGGNDPPEGIPVLSAWSLFLLGVAVAMAAMAALRRG